MISNKLNKKEYIEFTYYNKPGNGCYTKVDAFITNLEILIDVDGQVKIKMEKGDIETK